MNIMDNFSVLLSVYAKETAANLRCALRSILDQTLQPDQVVLVEDGVLGYELISVIEDYCNLINMTIVKLETNMGLAVALNEGLKFCTNDIVVRIDSDDISFPHRFQTQVEYLMLHPEVVVCSSWLLEFSDERLYSFIRKIPCEYSELILFSKYRNPIAHPSSAFRKNVILSLGGYPTLRKCQDYALWSKVILANYKIANLPDILVKMRVDNIFGGGRSLEYLKNEYKLFIFQYKIGFLTRYEFIRNYLLRCVLRLLPNRVKIILYKSLRTN